MAPRAERPLIVVTVGTDHHPFDRLVRWVDSWVARGGGRRARVLVQHGESAAPAAAEGRDYLAHDELEEALRHAAAVVCHGGPGTIIGARSAGVVPIVVPRQRALGEHVDDHQVRFARRLAAQGAIRLAGSEEELHGLLDEALEGPGAFRAGEAGAEGSEAVRRFGELVDDLVEGRPARAPGERATKGTAAPHEADAVKVLYIGGTGRSGSTLVDRMLGEIPGFRSAGELVHLWRRGLAEGQLCGCGEPFRDCPFWSKVGEEAFGGWDRLDAHDLLSLQHAVDRNRRIPRMLSPGGVYGERLRRYAGLLSRLYSGLASVSGARVVVDSSKHASTAFLLRKVPGIDLRVVHLVRDSRGVAHSLGKRVRRPEVVGEEAYMPRPGAARAGADWVAFNGLFEALRATGVPVLLQRYESFVEDPRAGLERMAVLAGLRPPPEAFKFLRGDAAELGVDHTVSGNPMRFSTGEVAIRRDDEWRSEMDPGRRRLVSAITAPLLVRYGYRLGGRG